MRFDLGSFIRESNEIEGIYGFTDEDLRAHETLLNLAAITVPDLELFVAEVAGATLRRVPGMNVRIGDYVPPKGGLHILDMTGDICDMANGGKVHPYELHQRYESLHPFMDGNGRSGRAIWAWMMAQRGQLRGMPFLQAWYYQSLGDRK